MKTLFKHNLTNKSQKRKKMKSITCLKTPVLIMTILALALTSCKKDDLEKGRNDPSTLTQLTTDEATVEDISNEVLQDVEGVLSYQGYGLKSTMEIPCNATIDSTSVINDTITIYITYDGLSCNGRRFRTGQVEIRKRVGTRWGMQGASVNVRYRNFSVTRVATGHTIVINSNKTFTNVTGGFIFMLGHNGFTTLTHRVEGTMEVTFGDNSARTWNVARQRTFTGTRGELILTTDGFGTSGSYDNLVVWGTNRNSEVFYTQIIQPVVYKAACDWNPVSGIKVHQIPEASKSATITFGFDSNYQPVTGDDCPTHYKVDWVNGTYTGSSFLPLR